jgi:thiamine pyrophosphate-dependent acetolactate synthase large subunit-like protein
LLTERVNIGEAIARVLEAHQVDSIYGVISIHNLPIADELRQPHHGLQQNAFFHGALPHRQ